MSLENNLHLRARLAETTVDLLWHMRARARARTQTHTH